MLKPIAALFTPLQQHGAGSLLLHPAQEEGAQLPNQLPYQLRLHDKQEDLLVEELQQVCE